MTRQIEASLAFLDDLKKLLNEEISCSDFKLKYHPPQSYLPMELHNLWHYIDDEGIRAKDSEYKDMQNKELKKLIGLIESGALLIDLQKIHFLGSTD